MVASLGAGALGLLVAVTVGAGAASYAVSGINPIYYNGLGGGRISERSADRLDAPDVTPTPASVPPEQYYYYRAEPVRAVYATDLSFAPPIPEAKRASRGDATDDGISPAVVNEPARLDADAQRAEEPVDTVDDGDQDAVERLPPQEEAQN